MKCCICNNDNIGEFITINGKKYHLCCIEQLKKQKDDVANRIKVLGKFEGTKCTRGFKMMTADFNDLLRMLGETNEFE